MFKIGNRVISNTAPPYVIAELSANHNGSINTAFELIKEAKENGADAIKLQTYTPESITLNCKKKDFLITDKKNIWKKNNSLFSLYKKAQTPWEWHKQIFEKAKRKNLIYFSSPFDETAVDFLEELNVPAYKIASFENNHYPLLKKVARTGKPVIMSLGLSTLMK